MRTRTSIHVLPQYGPFASCRCNGPLTPDPELHDLLCPYRLLRQIELMQEKAKAIYSKAETRGPDAGHIGIEQLAEEILAFKSA